MKAAIINDSYFVLLAFGGFQPVQVGSILVIDFVTAK